MDDLLGKNSRSQMGELLILYGKTITVNLESQRGGKKTGERRREDTNKQVEKETSRVSNMITQLASASTLLCCNTPSSLRRRTSGSGD